MRAPNTKQFVEFPLDGGGTVIVELEREHAQGAQRVGRAGEVIERAQVTFEEAFARVRPFAESALAQLRALPSRPDEATIQFGLKLNASAGAVIASTAVEGTCQITLMWKRDAEEAAKPSVQS